MALGTVSILVSWLLVWKVELNPGLVVLVAPAMKTSKTAALLVPQRHVHLQNVVIPSCLLRQCHCVSAGAEREAHRGTATEHWKRMLEQSKAYVLLKIHQDIIATKRPRHWNLKTLHLKTFYTHKLLRYNWILLNSEDYDKDVRADDMRRHWLLLEAA